MSFNDKLGNSTYSQTVFDERGVVQFTSGIDNVRQSIARALSFEGDSFFFPEKDSKLGEIQFRARTRATARLGAQFMKEEILKSVKTVRFVKIDFELPPDKPDQINYIITFEVQDGKAEDALIYPFFLNNSNELN